VFSDLADFAMILLLLPRLWHIGYNVNCQSPENCTTDFWQFIQKKKKMASAGSLRNDRATIGRSQPSQRDMPWYKSQLEAEL
jgi:hypothetical protein